MEVIKKIIEKVKLVIGITLLVVLAIIYILYGLIAYVPSYLIEGILWLALPKKEKERRKQEAEEQKRIKYRNDIERAIRHQAAINEQREKEGKEPIRIIF